MSTYLNVLLESAWTASIVPISSEASLYAMDAFGSYNMPLAVGLAMAGATLGQFVNWLIGNIMMIKRPANGWSIPDAVYYKSKTLFNKYFIFLLFFSWVTGGNILVIIAGFLGARPKLVMPLVIAGYLFHYGTLLV